MARGGLLDAPVAQVLLTHDDLVHRGRFLNAQNTFAELLRRGAIPIVNENDTVAVDELRVGDNDNLAAHVAVLIGADLLLVCPARTSGSMAVLHDVDHFAANVLHIGQQNVSGIFAGSKEDRFGQTEWEEWDTGAPIITNSLASFECRKYAEYDGGDHVILVGEVTRVRFAPQRDPLLYFRGKYRRLHFA